MGANISNQVVQQSIDSLTEVVNNTSNSVFQSVKQECVSDLKLTLNLGLYPVITGSGANQTITYQTCVPSPNVEGNATLNQFASGTCTLNGGISNTLEANYSAQLKQNIKSWIDQQQQQRNGFIAVAINIANTVNITNEQLTTRITNSITNQISQKCDAYVQSSAQGLINICANIGKDLTINQSAISTNITTCVTNNIVTAISNDSVLVDIVNKAVQQTSQDNEGFGDLARYLIIGGVILGVLIVIGVVLYLIFGKKENLEAIDPEKLKLSKIRQVTALKENIAKESTMKGIGAAKITTTSVVANKV